MVEFILWSVIMSTIIINKRIESKIEVKDYLRKLLLALQHEGVVVRLKVDSFSDEHRNERYTNRFTINSLFPDEDVVLVLKRELSLITFENYIKTELDRDLPWKLEFRIFGKSYGDDVYIKIRVMDKVKFSSNPIVQVMSFHYAMYQFIQNQFPCKGEDEKNEENEESE